MCRFSNVQFLSTKIAINVNNRKRYFRHRAVFGTDNSIVSRRGRLFSTATEICSEMDQQCKLKVAHVDEKQLGCFDPLQNLVYLVRIFLISRKEKP